MVRRRAAWLAAGGVGLLLAVAPALPAAAIDVDPIIDPLPDPPPPDTTTTLPPETTTTLPPETTTTLPPPPPPETTTTLPPETTTTLPPETTTTLPPETTTTLPPGTTLPPPPPPPETTTTTRPPTTTTRPPSTTNPPPPSSSPPTTDPPPIVKPVDPDDVPVIVFPTKSPTVLPSTTSTTVFESRDPEFTGRPGGSTGTTGSRSTDDPTTTADESGDVVLAPKVAVKTIPSARLLVDDGGRGPDGGQPSGSEVAVTDADGSTRVVSAPAGGGASTEEAAAAPVVTSRTGLTRSFSDSVSSPIGGLLVAALVSFVVAGAYCGWLLLARR